MAIAKEPMITKELMTVYCYNEEQQDKQREGLLARIHANRRRNPGNSAGKT